MKPEMHYTLLSILEPVFAHLPGGWKLEPVSPEFSDSNFRAVSEKAQLHFRKDNGRIIASAGIPFRWNTHIPHGTSFPRVTFDAGKSPERIATQLFRSLIPEAQTLFLATAERVAKHEDWENRRKQLTDRLRELTGDRDRGSRNVYMTVSGKRTVVMEPQADSVRFFEFYLDPEQAVKLVEFLKSL